MSSLLEITGDDISQLGDADLRKLIGLLCEADYRLAGLSTKAITWGGHQDARDGGLDVVVRGEAPPPSNSFVPRSITGFQVKKPDMPRTQIIKEMCPNGVLREGIISLIQEGGAYIIVSSNGSTTDTAIRSRIDAMKESVANEDYQHNLYLEFLDRGRVATWVRNHPFLILWVRNKIGRPLNGWRPYENWANAPGGIEEKYLLDDGIKLHDGNKRTGEGMSVEDGLIKLRSALSAPGTSIRLAGLSGVGKTRLVQAIFDERIGEKAQNKSFAFYTDTSYGPDPDPIRFSEQLIASKIRAILIIDNCPSELHRQLTQICAKSHSTISLLTVEYDIRDDLPDETSVFRVEPAGEALIYKLIRKRSPHISQIDAQKIASFSGGNARVAIALANTLQKGENLTSFRDDDLFERLFRQRHDSNESLLISAEACSLVYSFEGVDVDSEKSELKLLASLVNKSGADLYRDAGELKSRGLMQSRGVWRALLPQAIANRLAIRALESIPRSTIAQTFLNSGSERLIKSFTRRLNYLHDCEAAQDLVHEWLAPDGWLGKENCRFNSFGIEVFRNIAPVSPEKTLSAIEQAVLGDEGKWFTSKANTNRDEFVRLLRHLAYDQNIFKQSVKLMCNFALSELSEGTNNSTRNTLESLFYIYLSGTHASIDDRAKIIQELVTSEDQDSQELGLYLLDVALEAWHFSSSQDFGFGARSRDFGYEPKTREETIQWYETFMGLCTNLAVSDKPLSQKARKVLLDKLRGLWTKAGMFDALEDSIIRIHENKAWNEVWTAIRAIVRYDGKSFPEDILERLHKLEATLKPTNLLERARTYALSNQNSYFDLEDTFDNEDELSSVLSRIDQTTYKIGTQIVQAPETFAALLPELVSTDNVRLYIFGKGMAEGCNDKQELWQSLYNQLKKTPPEKRQIRVLQGFLSAFAEVDPKFHDSILDCLITDKLLGEWFPIFQMDSIIDKRGIERLHEALDYGKASIDTFHNLAFGNASKCISDDDLASLLIKIFSKTYGAHVAIKIITMRLYQSDGGSPEYSSELIEVIRRCLSMYPFSKEQRNKNSSDYELVKIANICLNGKDGIAAAITLCQNLLESITNDQIYAFDYPDLFSCLANMQPIVFLDVFLGDDMTGDYRLRRLFSDDFEIRANPLRKIADEDLISWCDIDPANRYPLIASTAQTFTKSTKTGELEWTPVVSTMFKKAPNLESILENIVKHIRPSSWSGSRADILQQRSVLFQSLSQHDNSEISVWATNQYSALQEAIKEERKWEDSHNREQNESFE